MDQKNGNSQVNIERDRHNSRVEKFKGLGSTKRINWNRQRRYKSI